jgi:HSP20 family protein
MTRPASELIRSFDRLFDDNFTDRFFAPTTRADDTGAQIPALDVTESDNAYSVKLDLPGMAKEDVKITIDGRRISVDAQKTSKQERKEGERVVYSERSVSSFARSFTLPMEVDQSDSTARMENGVLSLMLPKRSAGRAAQLKIS